MRRGAPQGRPRPWGPCSWCEGATSRGAEGVRGGGGRRAVSGHSSGATGPEGTRRSAWLRALLRMLGPLPSCPVTWRLRKAGLSGARTAFIGVLFLPSSHNRFLGLHPAGRPGRGWRRRGGLSGAAGDPSPGCTGQVAVNRALRGRRKRLTQDEEGFLEEALSALGAEWTLPVCGVSIHKGLGGRGQWERGCSGLQPRGGGSRYRPSPQPQAWRASPAGDTERGAPVGTRALSPDPGRGTARHSDLWVPGGLPCAAPLLVTPGIPGAEVWGVAERVVGMGSGGPGTPPLRGGSGRLLPFQAMSFL